MNNPALTLFYTECGCIKTFEELITHSNPYTCCCPERGRISHRTTACTACSKRFEFDTRGKVPLYCHQCKIDLKIRIRTREELSNHYDPFLTGHPNAMASFHCSDCIHRDACIDKNINKNFLPCLTCNEYKPFLKEKEKSSNS